MGSLDFNQYNFNKILDDIRVERIRQDSKYGITRKLTPTEWLPILVEEVGEFAKDICDENHYHENMRNELIQIAAIAIAILQDLDEQEEIDLW